LDAKHTSMKNRIRSNEVKFSSFNAQFNDIQSSLKAAKESSNSDEVDFEKLSVAFNKYQTDVSAYQTAEESNENQRVQNVDLALRAEIAKLQQNFDSSLSQMQSDAAKSGEGS